MNVDVTTHKLKSWLVIQGYKQKPDDEYFDIYASVPHVSTIRLLIVLASIHNLVIHQMYVKTVFLNGDLDRKVYMKRLEDFVMPINDHKMSKLSKSLYGLKQVPKQWHQKLIRSFCFVFLP